MTTSIMTFPQTYQLQFAFHFDVTQRLLRLAQALPVGVYHAKSGYGHDSMHNIFCHMVGAAKFWREVLTNTLPSASDSVESVEIANVAALVALNDSERKSWAELLATFDEARLFEPFHWPFPGAPPPMLMKWQALEHVILHGMQHHAELAHMLTQLGHSPGDLDFL